MIFTGFSKPAIILLFWSLAELSVLSLNVQSSQDGVSVRVNVRDHEFLFTSLRNNLNHSFESALTISRFLFLFYIFLPGKRERDGLGDSYFHLGCGSHSNNDRSNRQHNLRIILPMFRSYLCHFISTVDLCSLFPLFERLWSGHLILRWFDFKNIGRRTDVR